MDHRLIVRIRSGFCTDEDLKRYFRKENFSLSSISHIESLFIISLGTKEDRHKLLEKGVIKIASDSGESEVVIESDDDTMEQLKLSLKSDSEKNSAEYDFRSMDDFVVIKDEHDKDFDLRTDETGHESPPKFFEVEASLGIRELMKKAVKIQNVWSGYNDLRNFVAMEKKGGGDLEHECYSEKEGIAYFVFENPQVATNLLKKGYCKIMNHVFKFESPEVAEYISIKCSSPDEAKQSESINVDVNRVCEDASKIISSLRVDSDEASGAYSKYEMKNEPVPILNEEELINKNFKDKSGKITKREISFADLNKPDQEFIHSHLDITASKSDSALSAKDIQDLETQEKFPSTQSGSPKDFKSYMLGESIFISSFDDELIPLEPFMTNSSIAIYGIPSKNFIEDALLCALEHKRRGGGEVLNYEFDQSLRKLVATFQDQRVAQNFSVKKILKVQGHEVFILSSEEESTSRRMVFVPDVQNEEEADRLACYMESPRKGGGEIESDKYNEGRKEFWVRFVDRKVAEKFKKRETIKMLGVTFSMQEAPIFTLVEVDFGPRTVFVGSISEDNHQNVLVFLETDKFGGPVLHHKLNAILENMEVVFFSEAVAKKLLASKSVKIMEFSFPIAKSEEELQTISSLRNPNAITENQESDRESYHSCDTLEDVNQAMDVDQPALVNEEMIVDDEDLLTVAASNVPETSQKNETFFTENMRKVVLTDIWKDCTNELLNLLIKNKIVRDGGFTILDFNEEKRQALIEFDDAKDALRMFECAFIKGRVVAHLVESNPDDFESHAILVRNVKGVTRDMLAYYLENKRRSDGGPLTEWDFRDEDTFYAVFENVEDAKSFLNRTHGFEGREFDVQKLTSQPPPYYVRQELIDRKKLLVSNLRSRINKNYFIDLIERVGGAKVEDLIKGEKLAMLVFQSEPDYFSLRKYVSCYPVKGYMVHLSRVAQTDQIQVALLYGADVYSVQKHFQDRFGKVQFEVNKENGLMKVTFESHEAVQQFLSSDMMINGHNIDAKPYYKDLRADAVIPNWIKTHHDDEVLEFIRSQSDIGQEIEASLNGSVPVQIIWSASGSEIILNLTSGNVFSDWWKIAATKFAELLKPFHWREKTCLHDYWNEITEELKFTLGISKGHIKTVTIKYDKENSAIRFIGRSGDCDQVEHIFDEINNKILSRRQKVCEVNTFNPKQTSLIKQMFRNMNNPDDVNATFFGTTLKLEGPSECVNNFKLEILKRVSQFVTEDMHLQQNIDNFLRKKHILNYVNDTIEKNNILACFMVDSNDQITLIADCGLSLLKIREFIKSTLKEGPILLLAEQQAVTTLDIWKTFLTDLSKKLEFFEIVPTKENDILSYVCFQSIEKELVESVQGFLKENTLGEVFLEVNPGILETIGTFCYDEFKEINNILNEQGGDIKKTIHPHSNKLGFLITGQKSYLDYNVKKLEGLKNKIKVEKITLKKPGITEFFESAHIRANLNRLQTSYKVLIKVQTKDEFSHKHGDGMFEISFEEKPTIVVTAEDVLSSKVDVIVHVSRTALESNSQNIFRLGGDQMIAKTMDELQKISVGAIDYTFTMTHVGNLPCNSVCHIVVQNPDSDLGRVSLVMYIHEALKYANDKKYSSLLVMCPYMRGGADDELYLEALVQNLVAFDGHSTGTLRNMTILCADSEALKSCKSILEGLKKMERRKEELEDGDEEEEEEEEDVLMEVDEREKFEFLDFESILQGANMSAIVANHVEVVKGSIVNVKADVLVNSASKDLDLDKGQASKALLAVAGDEMQAECLKKKPKNFDIGDIVSTKGYRLKCERVYHVTCALWRSKKSGMYIRKIVRNVLTKASKKSYRSVAFPALGTGNLGAPADEVAFLIIHEAASFLERNKHTSIQKVYLVVYEKDFSTIKAFEDCWKNFTSVASNQGATGGSVTGGGTGGSTSGGGGDNLPITIDASDPCKLNLNGLEVEVVEGDITSFNADAIVNSTNDKMDLSGAVAKAIIRKGGNELMEEMKAVKMKPSGVCVTRAGNLPSNFIVHVTAKRKVESWSPVINQALVEADSYGCNTIAFPVLGTGNYKSSSEEMAQVMIQAFQKFIGSAGHKNLKKIFVCIFLKDIMRGFVAGVKRMDPNQSGGMVSRAFNNLKDTLTEGYKSLKNIVAPKGRPQAMSNVNHSQVQLEVYGPPSSDVSGAIKVIVNSLDGNFCVKTLDSDLDKETIAKLRKSQISRIRGLKEKHKVDVVISTARGSERIVVSGFMDNCSEAMRSVTEVFNEVRREEDLNKEADDLKEQTLWEFRDENNTFRTYGPKLNLLMEKAYTDGNETFQWHDHMSVFSINFKDMKQIENYKHETEIRRIITGNILPNFWSGMSESEKCKKVDLDPNGLEYKTVEQNARATASGMMRTIQKIERIQNPTLYTLCQTKKAAMEKSMPGRQVEMTLWHGTSANVVDCINEGGFNRSYCGKHATAFGRGVYFAKNFNYSAQVTYSPPDKKGIKTVYQCKVLVGEYTNGSQTFITPPNKPNSQDSYDSVVNNVQHPDMFVVFYDDQAYPEYLIHFS